jgi:transposase-like protein
MVIEELNEKNNGLPRKSFKAKEPDELYDNIDFDKMKVECICPKCGSKHMMNLHWIGRGTPRKFCHLCRSTVNSGD